MADDPRPQAPLRPEHAFVVKFGPVTQLDAGQVRKFAEIIGTLMFWGGADRLIWATGCIALHPRPFVEGFWRFKMPKDLIEDYGFPPLTPEVKQATLSGNIARILGLDLQAIQETIADDEFSQQTNWPHPGPGQPSHTVCRKEPQDA